MFGDDVNDIREMDKGVRNYAQNSEMYSSSVELILVYNLDHQLQEEYEQMHERDEQYRWDRKSGEYSIVIMLYESSSWICSYYKCNGDSKYTIHRYIADKRRVGEIHRSILEEGTSGLIKDYSDDSLLEEFSYRPEYEYSDHKILLGDENAESELLSKII